jgi:hypothetical protein
MLTEMGFSVNCVAYFGISVTKVAKIKEVEERGPQIALAKQCKNFLFVRLRVSFCFITHNN